MRMWKLKLIGFFTGSLVQFARPSYQNSMWEVSALALRLGIPSSFATILHNYRLAYCLDHNGIEALRQDVSLILTSNAHEPELSPKNLLQLVSPLTSLMSLGAFTLSRRPEFEDSNT